MAEEPESKPAVALGCVFLIAIAVAAVWVFRPSTFGCFLADQFDYVNKQCALTHLRRPLCNSDRDILDIDEITDISYTDKDGKHWQVRKMIYEFRKRPIDGPVSADVLRDNATLFKTANGQWLASCENLAPE
jgi:hypothetical protein